MISENDIPGFFIDETKLDPQTHVFCVYEFECDINPKLAAASLCSEQSTAQWKRPGLNEDFRPQYAAKVCSLEVISQSNNPVYSYDWLKSSGPFYWCRVRVAHPIINFGPRIPLMLSFLLGEGAFYCPGISSIRLQDIFFPDSYLKDFEGPQFGVAGLRQLLKIENEERPLFVGVVKPNIGLSPKDYAELAYQSFLGGLDIAKDDEMLGDTDYSRTKVRSQLTSQKRLLAEEQTGSPKLQLANLTDENDSMPFLYEEAKAHGANVMMLDHYFTGFSSIRSLRRYADTPIMTHFAGQALFDRMTHFGVDGVVLVKLQRMMGADIIGLPGFGGRMKNNDDSVLKNVKACLEPMGSIRPALPIAGGSDWAGTLPMVYEKIGSVDFGFISGRGIYSHPQGPKAGAQSLCQAWDAIKKKASLEEYAKSHAALKQALDFFK